MSLELNKSKQISLMAENVSLEQFGTAASIITAVINKLADYVED